MKAPILARQHGSGIYWVHTGDGWLKADRDCVKTFLRHHHPSLRGGLAQAVKSRCARIFHVNFSKDESWGWEWRGENAGVLVLPASKAPATPAQRMVLIGLFHDLGRIRHAPRVIEACVSKGWVKVDGQSLVLTPSGRLRFRPSL